jgi:hypothetical protein
MAIAINPLPPAIVQFVRTESTNKRGEKNFELKDTNYYKEYVEKVYLKEKFLNLKDDWELRTMFTSSIVDIVEDQSFQQIIAMGEKAIPLIIDEIEAKPRSLVWALNIIYKARLKSSSRLTVAEACKAWVKLYRTGQIS